MKLLPVTHDITAYLAPVPPVVAWDSPAVAGAIARIRSAVQDPLERARLAFLLARDDVAHSFDTGYEAVSITAEETLQRHEGICFAKSHLLASLLRGMGIPCGFCYQRVLVPGPVRRHVLHGLNAIHTDGTGWFRVDPRGNKPGIQAQFSTDHEQLAYPIRPELGEVDYPEIFAEPLQSVLGSMHKARNCGELFLGRPQELAH